MFKQRLAKLIKEIIKEEPIIETPKPELADYAFPCFSLAKKYKTNPTKIATQLAKKIKANWIEKIEVKSGYINFFINKSFLVREVVKKVLAQKSNYGTTKIGKGKKALVEHTSINPNASPHVGRARNAIIGDSIVRILKFQGYKVETHFYVNDIGKQVAMLVLGCKNKIPHFNKLLDIYIAINKKVKENPDLEKEALKLLKKLESGDKTIRKKFERIVAVCINGQKEIFSKLGIKYDVFDYESEYLWSKKIITILKLLERTGRLFTDNNGRKILNQEGFGLNMKAPLLVLTRADGTSLYPLRDIAYTIDKIEKGFDRNIIVLGEDQKLYYKQITIALELLNYKAPEVVHYSFVLLQEGKMSTRLGNLVLLEDFMQEAIDKAKREILKRNPNIDKQSLEKNAKIIGYGAIKYTLLKVSPEKNVIFDWKQALNFEGDSAAYLQYTYARICSILKKYKKPLPKQLDYKLLTTPSEFLIIKQIANFPEVVDKATQLLKPNLITNYLYNLAKLFNEFYHLCPILKAETNLKKARIVLISLVKQVLKNGLSLLGIDVLERM